MPKAVSPIQSSGGVERNCGHGAHPDISIARESSNVVTELVKVGRNSHFGCISVRR
jgi:hypothetical protein